MSRNVLLYVTAAALLAIGGCAAHPDSIPPVSVSTIPYKDLSCDELRTELRIATEQRDAYVKKQKGNRTRDGWLNALIIPGAGAVTSDHEDEVAQSKGRVIALEGEIVARCQ